MEVLKSEKDYAEFVLEGEKHSFPNLLNHRLLAHKNVAFVSYIVQHPMGQSSRFVVRTKGKSPKKVLEEAAKDVEAELDAFGKKAQKALK